MASCARYCFSATLISAVSSDLCVTLVYVPFHNHFQLPETCPFVRLYDPDKIDNNTNTNMNVICLTYIIANCRLSVWLAILHSA